jgi:hypothetical protein
MIIRTAANNMLKNIHSHIFFGKNIVRAYHVSCISNPISALAEGFAG